MAAPFALSLQDLAPIAEGTSTPQAMQETILLAQEADRLGYTRLWYAEHHGMPSIASSVPEILIGSAAAHTKNLRIGSGGVMLLNHAPLRIAEAYRTLEGLFPGRIDLGLGRAPGGDGYAMRALRSGGGEEFSTYLAELMAFDEDSFPPEHPYSRVPVSPGGIRLPPMWLLGSSGASASAAGQLGIGYAFAAHFSHTPPAPAFEAYRYAFQATGAFPKPQTMMCVSVVCAPTDEEAKYLSYSQAVQWALFMTGEQRRLMSPEGAHKVVLTPQQQGVIDHQSSLWIVGSPETVRDTILAKAEASDVDEVMITTTLHSYGLRRRSYGLVAKVFGIEPRG
ncbi:LLM class flavin-dependent oxidoreductase [Devosia psychrophila]|uniref:Luciferase-like monooxygenase n=1 Tax=Devosia psychrophila TaxID=728005 RepID=A0A0F5PYJ2_9HYPH|nr:LLM class flavin-dependent oxidoreductase [Devosia psychrophila]KKC33476.1 5,10-methylene tetrahydromethanopterin reductase [Devosia psychrophila]SFB92430.1 luciferase family oxidoreductase, group 1 [Devosia psychrophila]